MLYDPSYPFQRLIQIDVQFLEPSKYAEFVHLVIYDIFHEFSFNTKLYESSLVKVY